MVLPIILVLWGGISWLGLHWHPERNIWQGLLIGFVSTVLLSLSDFGHPFGHVFSARYAGAPMDEIVISGEMPHTLYQNNRVAPNVHRMRALGGPIFNLLGVLCSFAVFQLAPVHSLVREWMGWSTVGHIYILLASLLPLPMVDGGTILKWTLVARGKTEAQADDWVRRIDWILGFGIALAGIGFAAAKIWISGLICIGVSAVVFGIAAGKIR